MKILIKVFNGYVCRLNPWGNYEQLLSVLNKKFPGEFKYSREESSSINIKGAIYWIPEVDPKDCVQMDAQQLIMMFVDGYIAAMENS